MKAKIMKKKLMCSCITAAVGLLLMAAILYTEYIGLMDRLIEYNGAFMLIYVLLYVAAHGVFSVIYNVVEYRKFCKESEKINWKQFI